MVDSDLSLIANARGEVFFWSMLTSSTGSSSVLKRWDQASHSTMTVQNVDHAWSVVADDDRLYWSGVNAAGRTAFFSTSTKGGTVTQVQEWSSEPTDPRLLKAVDDQSLYFTRPSSTTKGIFAIPKTGGDSRTVAANVNPLILGNKNIDDTHVYWIDISDRTHIQRARKTGNGGVEKFVGDEDNEIADLAVDRCNVYWTPTIEPRILVRGK